MEMAVPYNFNIGYIHAKTFLLLFTFATFVHTTILEMLLGPFKCENKSWSISGKCSLYNGLQVLLALLSLVAAVMQVNSAFHNTTSVYMYRRPAIICTICTNESKSMDNLLPVYTATCIPVYINGSSIGRDCFWYGDKMLGRENTLTWTVYTHLVGDIFCRRKEHIILLEGNIIYIHKISAVVFLCTVISSYVESYVLNLKMFE